MQNAYSRQASVEIEQQLGLGSTVSVGYQYTRGLNLIISVNQNVPTCVAAGTNNGCRPISTYANNSQYSPVADSNYHGLHVSFVQRPAQVGELPRQLRLLEVDEQRRREHSSARRSIRSICRRTGADPTTTSGIGWSCPAPSIRSMEPARTAWERISHGFQVSSMLQSYSALPFNITSGVTTVQGTAGRPIVNGAFIERNAGVGSDFFSLSLRVSRAFRIGRGVRAGRAARGVQPDESRQQPDAELEFRDRRLPDESIVDVQSDHGGRAIRERLQFGVQAQVLRGRCNT